jgi:hypothetical protein
MSNQITTAFVEQYKNNVFNLVQQKGSRLRNAVMTSTVVGKRKFTEQIGNTEAIERITRHGDSPLVNTPHVRRSLVLADYEWGDLIDDADRVRLLIDPTDAYAQNAAWAMGRAMDDVLITAMLGTAKTGVSAGTDTVLPASQKIAAGSTGLTLAKLLATRELFTSNDVDPSEPLYMAVNANMLSDLLDAEEMTSADYNTVKALVRGEINSFMGFQFIHTQRLTGVTADRKAIAWAKNGVELGIGADIKAQIAPRPDKAFSTYIYYAMSLGATRLEEEKVVEIGVKEDHA